MASRTNMEGTSRRRRRGRRLFTAALFAWWALLQQRSAALAAGVAPRTRAAGAPAGANRAFDIAPGPLADALAAFRAASPLEVAVAVPDEVVASLRSPGASGTLTDEAALARLLEGTGLSAAVTARRAEIRFAYEASVDVAEEAPTLLSQSLPKYATPIEETPQSIDVVGAELMEQQAASTLRDALRNVAGISLAAGEGGFQGDSLTIRGFTARGDLHLDGMRDFGSYYRDPFAFEEVQVLKGPSGLTFGRGATGGVVNQVSRLPRLDRFGTVEVELGSAQTRRVTLDLCEPFEKAGNGAFRIALMGHDADVPGRDVTHQQRFGVAPSIAFGLGTPTRVTLAHVHQEADDVPDYGIPWYFDGPADVARDAYYGFREGNFLETDVDVSTVEVEHDFGGRVTLRNQLRNAESSRRARITEARLVSGTSIDTPLDDVLVDRIQIDARSRESFLQDQLDVSAELRSGRVTHHLVAGIEIGDEASSPVRRRWDGVPQTWLTHPDTHEDFAGTPTITSDVEVDADTLAAYVMDTAQVTKRLSLVGGLRWDRFSVDYRNEIGPVEARKLDRADEATTWRAGAVYEVREGGNVYASVATSFNPSAESLALSVATQDADPERNRSLELGTKWELGEGRFNLRAAIFRTDKTDARESVTPTSTVNSGHHRVDGFELEAHGRVTKRWQIQAGYALLDSEVVESEYFPDSEGKPLANVPRHTFSAWSTHDLPWRLQLGWGARHVSSRTGSSTAPTDATTGNLREVPGYWTFDAMLARPIEDRWTMQLNVTNLTDESYIDQVHNGHLVPGVARSAVLGVRFEWGAGR